MFQQSQTLRRKIPWHRKLIYSLIPALLLFLFAELLLAALGVRPVIDRRDPYVGFARQIPLFEEVRSGSAPAMMRTVKSKLVWFNEQSFPKIKPPATKRIFCVGGSTTFGRPYSDTTSYSGWMRELLPLADSSCKWEVINAGGVSYASYRVAVVMEELSHYEPDLFVVYSAHNEFLERRTYAKMFEQPELLISLQAALSHTRMFALFDRLLLSEGQPPAAELLPAEVDERLNHTIGPADYHRDPQWHRKVVAHYRLNLRRMVRIAEDCGAQILFVTPASNEKDCSPFKSELNWELSSEEQFEFNDLISRAQAAHKAQQFSEAADLYRQALAIDPRFAEVHFRLGKSLFELGAFDAAQAAFARAIEEDVCPLRAIEALSVELNQVARDLSVPLVDFPKLLRERSQQQLGHASLGDAYFLDHVHPDIDTHRELAMWIIAALQQTGFVKGSRLSAPSRAAEIAAVIRRIENRMDIPAHGVALRNLAKVLHWSGKFEEAAPRASDALELLPNDPESRFVLADCLKNMGDNDGAMRQYELLFDHANLYSRALLPYGELLEENGRHEPAKAYLLLAILHEPTNPYAHFLLGKAHLGLDEYQFALECFQKAHDLYPEDPLTKQLLSEVSSKLGE